MAEEVDWSSLGGAFGERFSKQDKLKDKESSGDGENSIFLSLNVPKTGSLKMTLRLLTYGKRFPIASFHQHKITTDSGEQEYVRCARNGEKGSKVPCPICEVQRLVWDNGYFDKYDMRVNDEKKDDSEAHDAYRSRRIFETHYVNVLVVEDGANPENVGKVFAFRFGKTIMDMIDKTIRECGEDARVVFDTSDKGCDFVLDVCKNNRGYNNYDSSYFKRIPTAVPANLLVDIESKKHDVYAVVPEQKDYDTIAQDLYDWVNEAPQAWLKKQAGVSPAPAPSPAYEAPAPRPAPVQTAPAPRPAPAKAVETAMAGATVADEDFFDGV